ncbi:hypothetical protein KR009_001538 [Drosophila setifemur]|nr:hypothetical protein KR009_001538 [Drosophila setifemur]
MALRSTVVSLLGGLFLLLLVRVDVGVATHSIRLQQQRQAVYPAAGLKPARQFSLPKPARLVANSEAQEDFDDAEEVEVPRPKAPPVPAPVPAAAPAPVPAVPVTPTIAYYPAGAVGFVQPATYAKIIAGPQYVAPPQYYAGYFG